MSLRQELHAACDHAAAGYAGEPVEVVLPPGVQVQDLHSVVVAWREMGWTVDADSGRGTLVLS